ncbi:FmdB family zinc ribbon protein [Reticulibacter mediterranei]|uniref:FmdB family zinc ribbon protein n=1 Tax=Reticulibacter mediterranei TaxID=2778369 RepID=UPI001C68BC0C|nr:FmdB family zinc ribbon protein [Reticulibacter mediterranei]
MPLYAFHCEHCGPFECWRSLNDMNTPMVCPQCQTVARRVYTIPGLVKTPPALGRALYRAEKSAYEPEVLRREAATPTEEKPSHVIYPSHGRPWQIGH